MTEVSSPILAQQQSKEEYSADSDYCSQENDMETDESNDASSQPPQIKEEDDDWAGSSIKEEPEDESDDDIPWAQRMKQNGNSSKKRPKKGSSEDEDYKPDKKIKKEAYSDEEMEEKPRQKKEKKRSKKYKSSDEDDDFLNDSDDEPKRKKKKSSSSSKSSSKKPKKEVDSSVSPKKRVKKEEDLEDVWEWWKEEKKPEGVKWNSLTHMGPLFAPAYEVLPDHVHFKYNGKVIKLSPQAEEVAGFYARMLDHEYVSKVKFNENFFKDWKRVMNSSEREKITDLAKCDFREMDVYFKEQSEKRKAMSKEEKLTIKEGKEAEVRVYGIAVIDGHRQKIGNFRIEPPGLFRGRGEHPKMGRLKRRIQPEDVIINCGKGTVPTPPEGHKWKEVRHDNKVTWLCSWTESVLGSNKYIMLNPASKLKGEKDFEKYETARRLKKKIGGIRSTYREDWKSKEMRIRQRAVALYFIDILALRAGNEKDTEEAADTVGCCSLRVEHIKLHEQKDGKENVVEFDFLGKDSIRYQNDVAVEKRVFKNLKIFMENKGKEDDLFDRLDTATLNEHLGKLMPGLTAKVFRTYNASITLQEQLQKLTNPKDNVVQKMLQYNRANRAVAVLCNHQRAPPKTHEQSMEKLEVKIKEKKKELKEAKKEREGTKGAAKEKAEKKVARLKEQLDKLEIARTDKDENKKIALGTSKLNYLDPRISVAWCKKHNVPLEKVFSKTHREKFRWAIDMVNSSEEEYIF